MSAPWLAMATHFKGLAEVHGATDNPLIVEMFRVSGHPEVRDDETPWCAAFVGACLRLSGYAPSGSLGARSYEHFGDDLRSEPRRGCIAVFWRESPSSGKGHVAFLLEEGENQVSVLGGNQGDAVTVARYPRERLLGYRWPIRTADLPTNTTLPNILTIDPSLAPPHLVVGVRSPPPPRDGEALAEGMTGRGVVDLQSALAANSFSPGPIDGEFGPLTRTAVANFQRATKLPVTGIADAATLRSLGVIDNDGGPAVQEGAPTSTPPDVVKMLVEAFIERQRATGGGGGPVVPAAPARSDRAAIVQALLAAFTGKAPPGAGASAPDAASEATPPVLSAIDKVLGGEALAGKKTLLSVVAYAVLSILQAVGVAGTATGTTATPTGQILTTLIGAFGALGGLSKIDRVVQVLGIIAGKASLK